MTPEYVAAQSDPPRAAHVITGLEDGPVVLFIHGSPGRWTAFLDLLTHDGLRGSAKLIAVDRPGYGDTFRGRPFPDLDVQVGALLSLPVARGQKMIVVGHSLGGVVAARLAMTHPDRVSGLILVNTPFDPKQEEPGMLEALLDFPLISALAPTDLRTSHRELLPLGQTLKAMEPHWSELELPMTLIFGDRDPLVSPAHRDYIVPRLTRAHVTVETLSDMDHLALWKRPDLIVGAIGAMCNPVREKDAAPLD